MIREIEKETLNLILHASKHSHPQEFVGILRCRKNRITEVLFLPGTTSSENSAIMKLNMLPISSKACGTVHSHPTPEMGPSSQDLKLFGKFGQVHIIVGSPYNEESWKSYNRKGEEVDLEIVESEEEGDG